MRRLLILLVLVSACSSKSNVPCTEQVTCEPFGAFCVDGFCRTREELDLGPDDDFGFPEDLSMPDQAMPMCTGSMGCSDPTLPICDAQTMSCRGCAAGECSGATPICLPTGACVQCAAEVDCAATQAYCELASHTCTACTAHAQCSGGICDAGKCIPEASIVYVSADGSCDNGQGTRANPVCGIDYAAGGAGVPYIVVLSSVSPLSATYLAPTKTIRMLVVGASSTIMTSFDLPGLTLIANAGLDVTLILDGFVIRSNGTMNNPAILCGGGTGTHHLVVRNSRLSAATGSAYRGNACDATIEDSRLTGSFFGVEAISGKDFVRRNVIDGNTRGGIYLSGTPEYEIENNLIIGNGGAGAESAVRLGDSKTGLFRFNDVFSNVSANAYGAIDCGTNMSNPKTIAASLVFGNTFTGSQIADTCTLTDVITPSTDSKGTHGTPVLVGGTDYRLATGNADNQACCTNKVDAGPALDLAGKPRPLGGKWDIGAYEVE